MRIPQSLKIPVDEIFVSALAEQALNVAGVTAETIAEQFARGAWDLYGPTPHEVSRALQYRLELTAAFVLPKAGRILLARWRDGYLDLVLELEPDD